MLQACAEADFGERGLDGELRHPVGLICPDGELIDIGREFCLIVPHDLLVLEEEDGTRTCAETRDPLLGIGEVLLQDDRGQSLPGDVPELVALLAEQG